MPVLACGRVESEVTRGAEIKYLEEHIWQFYTTAGKQRGGGGRKEDDSDTFKTLYVNKK